MKNGNRPAAIRTIDGSKLIRVSVFFIMLLSSALVIPRSAVAADRPIDVSLINLIANPGKYEGKLVRVQGYMTVMFELSGVWLHKDDYENYISQNAVSLGLNEEQFESLSVCNKRYGFVVGHFHKSDGDIYSGSLDLDGVSTETWKMTRCPNFTQP